MLDEIDQQIVAYLQAQARATNTEIARAVGLSASSVYERVRKLEERGVLRGYMAVVDPVALGRSITAFVRVRAGHEPKAFETVVTGEPSIQECYGVTGDDCYILKLRVRDTAELQSVLLRLRASAAGANTVTMIVLETIKENSPIPATQPTDAKNRHKETYEHGE